MNLISLKIAFRNLLKNKTESLISIFGLGIGLGCILILAILVIHEFSFDRFIPGHQSAYRVIQGEDYRTPYPLAEEALKDIPEVDQYFRFFQSNNFQIKNHDGQILTEDLFAFSDASLFDCLGTRFKYGIPAASNSDVAISESMAEKYFNSDNVLGNSLVVKFRDDFLNLTITGVYKDFPSNSTLHPEFVADLDLSGEVFGQTMRMLGEYGTRQAEFKNWSNTYFYTYLFLNPESDPEKVSGKLQNYIALLDQERWSEASYSLQPVTDIYFHSNDLVGNLYGRAGNIDDLKYYLAIAFVILCIAVINYIFLTKAKIINRLIELGAKKALGATNGLIRKQVLFEANLTSALSFIPALAVILLGIPFVNSTLAKTVGSDVLGMWQTWLILPTVIILTGSLSGLIIGTAVSRASTVQLLSGRLGVQKKRHSWNNSFLSFHFAIFIILVVSVLTFKKQINYSLTNFKAIDPTNILVCELNTPELAKQIGVIQNELEKNPGVVRTAGSSFIPPFNNFLPINLRTGEESIRFDGLIMGAGMIELLGIEVVDGVSFSEFEPAHANLIINESAAAEYNIKAGEKLNAFLVKGIVKDFNAHSMHSLIQPMAILQQHPEKMRLLAVKTNGLNDQAVIAEITSLIKGFSPDAFIRIDYLTDHIRNFYQREQNQARLISVFSILAVALAVMGLFGIVLITISRRTKEIGIRKVNGAKIWEVVGMLNAGFLKWVVVSFVIAIPVSYYLMSKWLENFAYHTGLSWWIFGVAAISAILIAVLTVNWQSWKAASRNPVEALRYE